ncbi:3-keto-5-aminohexanoate cleavage protein [Streptomyces sp. NPDC060184]|uniref:3-keto-5-aminohexanoate cleavage protein n=1 Tax=Streptomyces sp. NPDC060184 TaxID=3347064 RepID=UPI00365C148E
MSTRCWSRSATAGTENAPKCSTWPVLDLALARGLETRIGLEDTLTAPDGPPVADNGALVRLALSRAA